MCSESLPKEFEKTSEVLPFPKYGLSSTTEFKEVEKDLQQLEFLRKVGLSPEEIKLYQDNQSNRLHQRQNFESGALSNSLQAIHEKIDAYKKKEPSLESNYNQPSTSSKLSNERFSKINFYPEGHPMNEIKEIDQELFGHLKDDNIIPITKRLKILRRLERRKERVLTQEKHLPYIPLISNTTTSSKPGSLWDLKDIPKHRVQGKGKHLIGPKNQKMYTVKENKIVRLEPVEQGDNIQEQHYQAVDIVMPVNRAEAELLEGTKMAIDDIKKIDRFKDYEPGIPSKVLYLKNISQSVSQDRLSLLFNQFVLDNGGPIDVRLMTGRMRGQAFVAFENEDTAIQALQEINGTILNGQPIIAQFGRNSNRIQEDNR